MKNGKIIAALFAVVALLGFSACSRVSSITSVYELNGKRIGVRTGTTGETWVTANLKNADITSYISYTDAVVDLRRGIIDAIIVGEMRAKELTEEFNNIQILSVPPSFFFEEYVIAVQKGNAELLNAINSAIEKAMANGDYDRIYSSFIEPENGNITIPSFNVPAGSRTLRVGTNSKFAPFGYMDGDQVVGFDISLAQLIAREYGANLEIVDIPFTDLIDRLVLGNIDLIAAAMTITEERNYAVDCSVPYFTSEQVIVVKK